MTSFNSAHPQPMDSKVFRRFSRKNRCFHNLIKSQFTKRFQVIRLDLSKISVFLFCLLIETFSNNNLNLFRSFFAALIYCWIVLLYRNLNLFSFFLSELKLDTYCFLLVFNDSSESRGKKRDLFHSIQDNKFTFCSRGLGYLYVSQMKHSISIRLNYDCAKFRVQSSKPANENKMFIVSPWWGFIVVDFRKKVGFSVEK